MIQLAFVAFFGANKEAARVDFGEHLTVVRGPSDTGKSFLVDAIDFMLGSRELKYIPERDGYADAALGVRLDGVPYTLVRSVTGGAVSVYEGLLDSRPTDPPPSSLSPTHNPNNHENLSMWLLRSIGVDGARLRKNRFNATDSLSFRDLAHLAIIDETSIQGEVPPPLTGRYDTKTKEVALLKLLLEGEDDSGLTASPTTNDQRRVKGAKRAVVEQLISSVSAQLPPNSDAELLRDQLARLAVAIEATTRSIATVNSERVALSESLNRDLVRARAQGLRLSQLGALRERFVLLGAQYESDISRLELVAEGGALLGYFEDGPCPLCGAAPEHQEHEGIHVDGGDVAESAATELARTRALAIDLVATIHDLDDRGVEATQAASEISARIQSNRVQVEALDQGLSPHRDDLASFVRTKADVEAELRLHNQRSELEHLLASIDDEEGGEAIAAAAIIPAAAVNELSSLVSAHLEAWGFPDAASVRYDRTEHDLHSGEQFRSAHGKGVRSVLHAAFTLGLADYCIARDLPHPGFVVLDSPVLTYRAPGAGEDAGADRDFATRFYHDIERTFRGQAIVIENTDPLDALSDSTQDVQFTKVLEVGRYGFFPYTAVS